MKQLFNYFRQRRERKLREKAAFKCGGLKRADMFVRYIKGDPNVLDEWKELTKDKKESYDI